ncbi:acyl-CoA dehydrogenase family protein [Rhodococcus sp. NPDC079359]|jgi:alkylation response protein AidB-like acyl-CoA dehydrogenase|uniref:acyl-CoA dehydrogenase family protein n=1 Tax=Rhodococcus sp. NPDC079359 TaxID=3154961 RepID=UPI003003716A
MSAPTVPSTPAVPSLVYDATQDDLRSTLRRLLDSKSTSKHLLALAAEERGYDCALWTAVARDMGLAGLLVPENYGGAGASVREVAVVMEELGRALAPIPYLASAVLATSVLTSSLFDSDDSPDRVNPSNIAGEALGRLADGEIGALVVPATTGPTTEARSAAFGLRGRRIDGADRITLDGTVTGVYGADCAALFVVPAVVDGVETIALVEESVAGLSVSAPVSLDVTRPVFDVHFDGVEADVLISGPSAATALDTALDTGAAMLASEQVGVGDWALESARNYLTIRHQFGRPLGSYQSLRHRAAQLWIDNQQARAAAQYAAATLTENSSDTGVAVSMAKAYCAATALTAVEECFQMHGGIGFTWEHPVHFYLARAFTSTVVLGSAEDHHNAIGALVDLPAS